ncbi:MAG: NUDIX domain-containing protein [Parcubacteria group bacterium]|jgi:isopentenyldiphosphate isomerase
MADERIDICDETNHLTGFQRMKSEAHENGLWHRVAHVWIYNTKGDILIQLRAKEKLLYPNRWDVSVAGHVGAGEEPLASALREVQEEIGLTVKEDDLQFFMIRKVAMVYENIHNNEFYYVYFLPFDGDIAQVKLQKEEVQEIRFVSTRWITADLKNNPDRYVRHGKYWNDAIDGIESILHKK